MRCSIGISLSRIRLFGVEDRLEEQDTDGGENNVVAEQLLDPTPDLNGIQIGCKDAGSPLNHRQKGWKRDWEQQ